MRYYVSGIVAAVLRHRIKKALNPAYRTLPANTEATAYKLARPQLQNKDLKLSLEYSLILPEYGDYNYS